MKTQTEKWLKKAEGDYRIATRFMKMKRPIYDGVCFHAQQCVEKYIKAYLHQRGAATPKKHDLSALTYLCANNEKKGCLSDFKEALNAYFEAKKNFIDTKYKVKSFFNSRCFERRIAHGLSQRTAAREVRASKEGRMHLKELSNARCRYLKARHEFNKKKVALDSSDTIWECVELTLFMLTPYAVDVRYPGLEVGRKEAAHAVKTMQDARNYFRNRLNVSLKRKKEKPLRESKNRSISSLLATARTLALMSEAKRSFSLFGSIRDLEN